ncbi:MAG: long-chain fatty acid--CoA ligase, partial [Candidatus Thiodiazotropha sp. (ex Semelilucina semeliformis)]|nr:long-chain fatty acid--CoA ligase [Candidatus Thiodiazotropha sp. (ex Semelilucina semeliformis)]
MLLLNRFKGVVASQPDAIAVKQGDNSFSYRELNRTASSVAWYLQDLGISRGDRVALVLPNSFEYIAVFYGIWLSGGITVALNTQAKASDISNWVEHSDAEYLFIDENHTELGVLDELIKTDVTIVPVNCSASSSHSGHSTTWHKIVNGNIENDYSPPSRDDVASIIYTSGTSGSPKGVTLTHGNLNSNIDSILGYLSLSSRDSILNVLPFFYSYGNSILHTHLVVGARLVLENS